MSNKIIYIPLEHIDQRYTTHLDRDVLEYLRFDHEGDYMRIYPSVSPTRELPDGMFLDAPFTSRFKALQLAEIAKLFETEEIQDGDIIFFSDIWFPGIEAIDYMRHFTGIDVEIRGILHAGSFTDTDEVRHLERWAKNFEDIVFDIADKIYVGSHFLKNDVIKKRIINSNKIEVTRLPLDLSIDQVVKFNCNEKEQLVVFNARNHPEKQPDLWKKFQKELVQRWHRRTNEHPALSTCPYKFIWTLEEGLSKQEYYEVLAKARIVVSFALQENFGFGIAEAVLFGCIPIVPNRLVYPELYKDQFLYNTFDEAVDTADNLLSNNFPLGRCVGIFRDDVKYLNSFKESISKWFN